MNDPTLREKVTEILARDWDPIGLTDFVEEVAPRFRWVNPADDYAPYAVTIADMLKSGATRDSLMACLEKLERQKFASSIGEPKRSHVVDQLIILQRAILN